MGVIACVSTSVRFGHVNLEYDTCVDLFHVKGQFLRLFSSTSGLPSLDISFMVITSCKDAFLRIVGSYWISSDSEKTLFRFERRMHSWESNRADSFSFWTKLFHLCCLMIHQMSGCWWNLRILFSPNCGISLLGLNCLSCHSLELSHRCEVGVLLWRILKNSDVGCSYYIFCDCKTKKSDR